jgi:hypothetical protein
MVHPAGAVGIVSEEENRKKMKSSVSNKTSIKSLKPSYKGAYSSKKLKPTELPNKLVNKLNKGYTESSQSAIKSKEHQINAYCKTKDISKLEEPFVSHSEWAFIPMKVLAYNSPFDLDKNIVFYPIIPFTPTGQTWRIYKEYNNYNQQFLRSTSVENNLEMDVEWLQKQKNYIMNMSKYDLFTLKGYTHYGDVLVNSLLRDVIEWDKVKTMNTDFFSSFDYFPVYFQLDAILSQIVSRNHHGSQSKLSLYALFDKPENTMVKLYTKTTNKSIPRTSPLNKYVDIITIDYNTWKHSDRYIVLVSLWGLLHPTVYKKVIELFQQDLSRIINKSPPLTKDVVVFRGVKKDFYLKGARNGYYKNIGFVSTSMDVEKAQFFQRLGDEQSSGSDCCIQRITLVKGTRALLMMPTSQYGDEKEVLLNHGSTYKIIEPRVMKTFYNKTYEKSYDICKNDTYQVYVSDIVLTS